MLDTFEVKISFQFKTIGFPNPKAKLAFLRKKEGDCLHIKPSDTFFFASSSVEKF